MTPFNPAGLNGGLLISLHNVSSLDQTDDVLFDFGGHKGKARVKRNRLRRLTRQIVCVHLMKATECDS